MTKDRARNVIEKPQWMWMRVAMGLSLNEQDPTAFAVRIYGKLSQLKYLHSTPTLYNSGTPFSQLSSCYISVVGDSIDSIMGKATESAQFAKYAGGVGMSVTKIRAGGSHIKSINSKSSGPIPFIKIYDTVINSIMQGGRRRASQVLYMEPWHYNFHEFLELKDTNGSPYLRTPSLNTACWIPDEFMQRVENNQDRYFFDPAECNELTETRGADFSRAYNRCIEKAESGEYQHWKKEPAIETYRMILFKHAKTGNYWVNFKDTHNRANQAPNYSMIHSSNLCTEISIANNEDSTAVCTLASLNLSRFIDTHALQNQNISSLSFDEKYKLINWDEMKETIQIAIRALDNVLENNFYPSAESRKNSVDLRPLGLGLMGLAELFINLGIAFESQDAIKLSDKIGAFIYENALATSKDLAKERGTFADYSPEKYPYEPRRNTLLMAVAPTASISLIAGTSSTVDPYFANVYSRETLGGKFTIIIRQLVEQLKAKGLWSEQMKNMIIGQGGSLQNIEELDGIINKDLFKTAYETNWKAQIDIAAALQKHVDQAISRNMYLYEELRDQMDQVYMYARKQGLKGTYYCFIEKKIQGEKYTQSVNKRGTRAGFRAMQTTVAVTAQTEEETVTNEGTVVSVKRGFGSIQMQAQEESLDDLRNQVAQINIKNITDSDRQLIEKKLLMEKGAEYVDKLKKGTLYNGNCPADPFEAVMCEGCQ